MIHAVLNNIEMARRALPECIIIKPRSGWIWSESTPDLFLFSPKLIHKTIKTC